MGETRVLVEKLERVFVERVGLWAPERAFDGMSLGELFYYALMENGDDRGLRKEGAMLGA